AYFQRMSELEKGPTGTDMKAILTTPPPQEAIEKLSLDPLYNSTMRTTCVATRLNGGHANNALPQMAQANVNCRILPGHSAEEIRQALVQVVADPKVEVQYVGALGSITDHASERVSYAPPPLRPEVINSLERVSAQMWPGAPVIPGMGTGASDGVSTKPA